MQRRKKIVLIATAVLCTGLSAYTAPTFMANAAEVADAAVPPLASGAPLVSADATLYDRASRSSDWVTTPNGLMNRTCVHALPEGDTVDGGAIVTPSGSRQTVPDCRYPRLAKSASTTRAAAASGSTIPKTKGWLGDSWWTAPTWLRRIWVNYAVPSAPARSGAITFIFSSFEPASGDAIVQPVLTYGKNGDRGGSYWYLTSWYVWGNKSVIGADIRVNPGDTVEGLMEGNSCNSNGTGCHWAIRTVDKNSGKESRLDITSAESYTTAQGGVLESYGASGCNMLPADKHIAFRAMQIFGPSFNKLTPAFGNLLPDRECGMKVTSTPTTTDINWTA
jgi:hypothetical protein